MKTNQLAEEFKVGSERFTSYEQATHFADANGREVEVYDKQTRAWRTIASCEVNDDEK